VSLFSGTVSGRQCVPAPAPALLRAQLSRHSVPNLPALLHVKNPAGDPVQISGVLARYDFADVYHRGEGV